MTTSEVHLLLAILTAVAAAAAAFGGARMQMKNLSAEIVRNAQEAKEDATEAKTIASRAHARLDAHLEARHNGSAV